MDPSLPSTKIRVISGLSSPPKDGLCIFVPPSLPTSVYFPLEIVAFSYNLSLFPPLPSLFQCLIFTNTYLFVICSPPAGSLSLICFSLILKLLASPDCDHSPLLLIRDLSEISYHLITPSKEVSQVLPGACWCPGQWPWGTLTPWGVLMRAQALAPLGLALVSWFYPHFFALPRGLCSFGFSFQLFKWQ